VNDDASATRNLPILWPGWQPHCRPGGQPRTAFFCICRGDGTCGCIQRM